MTDIKDHEVMLKGGMTAENVVLIENTIHRTKPENFKFIHSLLLHLEESNFPYSPHFLGIDDQGREMLSFIQGNVPRDIALTYQQKVHAIKILRQFHDILAGTSFSGRHETVCHNDFAPWNIIVKDGVVAGVIDFDEVAPGKRIDDVAYFIWTFLELGTSEVSDTKQIENIAGLVNAYDLRDREKMIDAFHKQQDRILKFRNRMILEEKDFFKKEFSKNAVSNIRKSIDWINWNKGKIEYALKTS